MLKFVNKTFKICRINRPIASARYLTTSSVHHKATQLDNLEKQDEKAKSPDTTSLDHRKLAKREPFVKNLFLGVVDQEILTYPEVLQKEEIDELEKNVDKFTSSYQHNVLGNQALAENELIGQLNSLQMFGTNISKHYDGQGFTATEYSLYEEKEAIDLNLATKMNAHRVVAAVVQKYGTDEQKQRYLPKLASGELIGSVCVFEETVPEDGFFNTTVNQDFNDPDIWLLNGKKSFVTNSSNASLLVVICQTIYKDRNSDVAKGVSAFLVDTTASKGITVSQPDETFGLREANQAAITFENTAVQAGNILGDLGQGSDIAMHMLQVSRIQTGVTACTLMKQMINYATDYCNDPKQTGMQLKENDLIKIRYAKTLCAEYALESMIYLTTGLYDTYEDQDVELEAAIVKVFAVENAIKAAVEPFHTFGPSSVLANNPGIENYRNATHLLAQGETLDTLKLFVGLSGLQHAGTDLRETISRIRNPLMHPKFILSKMFSNRNIDAPKSTLNLNYKLHPSLDPAAQAIEYSSLRLGIGAEVLLTRYGAELTDRTNEVMRITDAVVTLYAMYASAARASRSYCIGLRNADYEMLMANTFCLDGAQMIWSLVKDIDRGAFQLNDMNYEKIGKKLFESKQYYLEHPLKRNF